MGAADATVRIPGTTTADAGSDSTGNDSAAVVDAPAKDAFVVPETGTIGDGASSG